MNKRTVICVLFGCGAVLGAFPMLLPPSPYTWYPLLPGAYLTFMVTGEPDSLFWITVFNATVYGMVAVGLGLIIARPRAPVGDRCAQCSYDLTGNVSGVCPECGTPVAQDQREHHGE
ncbi:MAG: hypothetical protein ACYTFA_03830 [Planctomycetota bacterium]|jgi:hypothetical protein